MESDLSCSKALPHSYRSALLKGDLTKQMAAYGRWEGGGAWRQGEVALFSERGVGAVRWGTHVSPPLFNLSLCCHTLAVCFQ